MIFSIEVQYSIERLCLHKRNSSAIKKSEVGSAGTEKSPVQCGCFTNQQLSICCAVKSRVFYISTTQQEGDEHMLKVYTEQDLKRAIEIAEDAHNGVMRMDGTLYIDHPKRVMSMLAVQGYSEATQIVGVLHDVAEDCEEWPLERIQNEGGFDSEVIYPLALMTKEKGRDEYYYEHIYIPRIATHPRSRAVKRDDLMDNMDLTNIENPSPKQIKNIEKYGRALVYLSRFPQPRV